MRICCGTPATRRLLCELECCTRRPVVTISSPIEEREEEDGCEAISTHDSEVLRLDSFAWLGEGDLPSLRSRGGITADCTMFAGCLG